MKTAPIKKSAAGESESQDWMMVSIKAITKQSKIGNPVFLLYSKRLMGRIFLIIRNQLKMKSITEIGTCA